MVAFNQSDVLHFGAGFDWFGGSFYRQIFNDYHRIAILKDVAVCIFYFMRITRAVRGVPLKIAIGTGVLTIIDGIRVRVFALWADFGFFAHGVGLGGQNTILS